MPGPAFIRGDDVSLHVGETEDIPFLNRHRNDPAVRHGMTIADPVNSYQAEQRHEEHADSDEGEGFLVVPTDADDPVGKVVLFDIDETHGTGELACWIAPDFHGRGYATQATRLVIDYAFEERRLHKVVARALVPNTGSRTVLGEKLGLEREGVQRDQKYVDGEHVDVVRYAAFAHEWGEA